jgi:hypothetical protein
VGLEPGAGAVKPDLRPGYALLSSRNDRDASRLMERGAFVDDLDLAIGVIR